MVTHSGWAQVRERSTTRLRVFPLIQQTTPTPTPNNAAPYALGSGTIGGFHSLGLSIEIRYQPSPQY